MGDVSVTKPDCSSAICCGVSDAVRHCGRILWRQCQRRPLATGCIWLERRRPLATGGAVGKGPQVCITLLHICLGCLGVLCSLWKRALTERDGRGSLLEVQRGISTRKPRSQARAKGGARSQPEPARGSARLGVERAPGSITDAANTRKTLQCVQAACGCWHLASRPLAARSVPKCAVWRIFKKSLVTVSRHRGTENSEAVQRD